MSIQSNLLRAAAIAATVLLSAGLAWAEVPETIHYQGQVTVAGEPFDGAGEFKFALVDDGTENVATATATATVTDGFVTSITVTDPGSGYTSVPDVTISGREGSGATATAVVEDGQVIAIDVIDPGSGYSFGARVSVDDPPPATIQTLWSNDGSSTGGGAPGNSVSLTVDNGIFSVALGDTALAQMDSLPAETFATSPVFLRIWFDDGENGFTQLSPDQPLTSVPYSHQAEYALQAEMAASVANLGIDADGNMAVSGWVGTSGGNPLELRVGNDRAFRIEPVPETPPPGYDESAPNIIGGWEGNRVLDGAVGATIAGGGGVSFLNEWPNTVSGHLGTISGGWNNTTSGNFATVGGGSHNTASGSSTTVGGGSSNTASGPTAIVGGGVSNTASGSRATVGGGRNNTASGDFATVPGGEASAAIGDYSFAAGRRAKAEHDGAFVWSDSSTFLRFGSTAPDQFLIRADGGVGIGTDSPEQQLHVGGSVQANGNVLADGNVHANGSVLADGNVHADEMHADGNVHTDGDLAVNANASGSDSYIRFRGASGTTVPHIWHSSLNNRLLFGGMDSVRVDADFLAANRAGIGTLSPARDLHIKQHSTTNSSIGLQIERSGTSSNNWAFYIATSDNLGFRYNDQLKARINASNGEFVALSDERKKTAIEPLGSVLTDALQLRPSSYYLKHDTSRTERSLGLIAQEVKELFPSAVSKQEGVYGISYGQISVINTAALIELHEQFQQKHRAQAEKIAELENRLARIEALLDGKEVAAR